LLISVNELIIYCTVIYGPSFRTLWMMVCPSLVHHSNTLFKQSAMKFFVTYLFSANRHTQGFY